MKYRSHIVQVDGYTHTQCFVEVARAVDDALKELGRFDSEGIPIVFGAHLDKCIGSDAIIFNSEQKFPWDYRETLKKHRVWDYSAVNIARMAEYGIKAELCPIGYRDSMKKDWSVVEQDIDVLMYGSRNERRHKIYLDLCAAGLNTVFEFDCYGDKRDALIARAKIVLNVHYYDEAVFEIFRCSHLMANRKCVVSEVSKDGPEKGIIFIEYDNLVNMCRMMLRDDLRQEQEREAFRIFSATSMVDSLRELI